MSKPILCVDFDGVIHSYVSGWKGATIVADPPVPGALRWLWKATEWWDVNIYSSRSKDFGGIDAMADWLHYWAAQEWKDNRFANDFLAAMTFPKQKPAAKLTIDDRAICFEGNWHAVEMDPANLLLFKPWYQR